MWNRGIFLVLSALGLLTACGGGSGNVRPATGTFASFDAIQPNVTVRASGLIQSVAMDNGSLTKEAVDSVTADLSFNGNRTLTAIRINGRSSNTSLAIDCGTAPCAVSNGLGAAGALVDPASAGWAYQTFGYWDAPSGPTGHKASALSFGNAAAVSGLPHSGTATYSGASRGLYVNPTGDVYEHSSEMRADVDFAGRTVRLATTGTQIVPVSGGATTAAPDLNLSGNLTIASGLNEFNGSIATSGGMSGTATGRFYGPHAEEIGGVFECGCSGREFLIGAFGGKQTR